MDEDVYAAPESEIRPADDAYGTYSTASKNLVWVGILFQALLFVGLWMFITGLVQTYQSLQLYGTMDPKLMAGGISQALMYLILCVIPVTIGFLMSFITLARTQYRSKRVWKVELVFSFFYLLYFPIGTIIGLIYLVFLIRKRKDFVN